MVNHLTHFMINVKEVHRSVKIIKKPEFITRIFFNLFYPWRSLASALFYIAAILIAGPMVEQSTRFWMKVPLAVAGLAFFSDSMKVVKFSLSFASPKLTLPIAWWIFEVSSFL